jgi:hypothetical protein
MAIAHPDGLVDEVKQAQENPDKGQVCQDASYELQPQVQHSQVACFVAHALQCFQYQFQLFNFHFVSP